MFDLLGFLRFRAGVQMEVPDLLRNAVTRFPDRACVVEGDRALTFREVDDRASRAAAAFLSLGLERGDRVALLAQNELEYPEIQVAAQRAGLLLVPLNYRFAARELEYIISDCSPRLLIHGAGYQDVSSELSVEHTWHLGDDGAGDRYDYQIAAVEPRSYPGVMPANQAAAVMYTSGTTGRPKGAIISAGALWARLNIMAAEADIQPGDTFIQALPMFHIAAHTSYGFIYRGATIVLEREFHPARFIELMASKRATHVLVVPTMINLLTLEPSLEKADLGELRLMLYGASSISPEVLRRAIQQLDCGFLQFFGMTETYGVSLLRPEDHDPINHPERLASAGTDSISSETRIVDREDNDVGVSVVGEILSRGPALMDGYWNDTSATIDALKGGWMHTGDLGYRSADGYLFVTDRLKDMVVTGGENVYPREVEDIFQEHPAVLEAAVIGMPDDQWGERVHALVVLKTGSVASDAELIEFCRSRLANYKVPKSIDIVDVLPKNATGKVLKRELRESVAKQTTPNV
jgi:acyl-CoA synthetase (AMP-forming)/AMP-acid ligase II